MVERFIFDLDGTLIDTDWKPEIEYFKSVLSDSESDVFVPNINRLLGEYESTFDSYDVERLRLFLNNSTGINLTPEHIRGWRNIITNTPEIVFEGVFDTLEYLKRKGYSLTVLTNWFSEDQIIRLKHAGLLDYFEKVIGGDVVFKPTLRSFKCATGRFSPSECVMIGDSINNDVNGALEAGLDAIYFDGHDKNPGKVYKKRITKMSKLKEMY